MATIENQKLNPVLASVYDTDMYSQSAFEAELQGVEAATEVERQWIAKAELAPFESDEQVLLEAESGRLAHVEGGLGYIARQYLRNWTPERSDPKHPFHYSPPYVLPKAKEYIEELGMAWQNEMGANHRLSITSLVRSKPYQLNLANQDRKLTIVKEGQLSSHQVGLAFDVDGCGIMTEQNDGELIAVNPRSPYYDHNLVVDARFVLRSLLETSLIEDRINFVEELPGTQQHCFHVSLNPLQF